MGDLIKFSLDIFELHPFVVTILIAIEVHLSRLVKLSQFILRELLLFRVDWLRLSSYTVNWIREIINVSVIFIHFA